MNKLHLKQAIQTCEQGGVIAYPTESVFGLGCLPIYEHAVYRILKLKRRSVRKGLICVAADVGQLDLLVDFNKVSEPGVVLKSWPGAITWLIPARAETPYWLTGDHNTLAVRVSANPVVQAICQELGPIVSTSANRQGTLPAYSSQKVRSYFGNLVDYIYPATLNREQKPTEIRDAETNKLIRKS